MSNGTISEEGAALASIGSVTTHIKQENEDNPEIIKRLDVIYSMIETQGEAKFLAQAEHELKVKESDQSHLLKKEDSDLLIDLKKWVIGASLFFIVFNLLNLVLFLKGCYSIEPNLDWHLSLAVVIGSFTSAFGALAFLLKGVFQNGKSTDDLIPNLETIKEIIPLFKDMKP